MVVFGLNFVSLLSELIIILKKILFILLVFTTQSLFAQNYTSKNKKAIKFFEEGVLKAKQRDLQGSINAFTKATLEDSTFLEPHFRLGIMARRERRDDLAKKYLEVVARHVKDTSQFEEVFFELAEIYFNSGNFPKSCQYYSIYNTLNPDSKQKLKVANQLNRCNFIESQKNISHPIKLVKLAEPLNQFQFQYFPTTTLDENELYFTIRNQSGEDIYVSYKQNGKWMPPESVSENINTANNEGTAAISGDGKTIVFTACIRGNCDLYVSYKTGDEWSKPENLGNNINTASWESQASLSPDGRTIYFASNRAGGKGKIDIYKAIKDEYNEWLAATNLGNTINTSEDDLSPFIHPNGKTLFFASQGHVGFGGTDLFYTNFTNNNWSEPKNMGHPINTQLDEASIFITSSGKKAYFSVDNTVAGKPQLSSCYMYEFDIPQSIEMPNKTTYLKGKIADSESKSTLYALIEVVDLENGEIFYKAYSDKENGNYMISLSEGKKYAFFINKEKYMPKSLNYEIETIENVKNHSLDIFLDFIKPGNKFVLRNIYFATNSYVLDDKSKIELNKLTKFLITNNTQKIEIEGHTDDIGDNKANFELSINRAKSVVEYLVKNGIDKSRLSAKGYGETKPLAPNINTENRSLNRRIEVKLL
jgi:OmpA-OmpF porin, OOP family